MNKKAIVGIIIGVIMVIAAGVGITLWVANAHTTNKTTASTTQRETQQTNLKAVKACDLLTLDEAKTIIGAQATIGDNTDPVTNESISVDTCSYTNNATSVSDIRVITVTTRSALDESGQESNQAAFEAGGAAHAADAVRVDGYGQAAYWDSTTHQLAILNNNVWIGIVYGGTNPVNNTLEDAKRVADLLQ